jgi:hypothetical protein
MEDTLNIVTDDDNTPVKKNASDELLKWAWEEEFVEIMVEMNPLMIMSYHPPTAEWENLCATGGTSKILYLRKDHDTVRDLKIFISAYCAIDIAVENMVLTMTKKETKDHNDGSRKNISIKLSNDNQIVGLNEFVENGQLIIWVSKNCDMNLWDYWRYKVQNSEDEEERMMNKKSFDDTRMIVEDEWVDFVRMNLTTINGMFQNIEHCCRLMEERNERSRTFRCAQTKVEHIAQCRRRYENLLCKVLRRRSNETIAVGLERKAGLNRAYFQDFNLNPRVL